MPAGQGLTIERRGTRAGHQYQLLGHSLRRHMAVEPYLITLTEESDVFPVFQHAGVEFLYMLEGEVGYRHGNKTYVMSPGDSLFFDADVPHGPDELRKLPIRFLSIITYVRGARIAGKIGRIPVVSENFFLRPIHSTRKFLCFRERRGRLELAANCGVREEEPCAELSVSS